VNTLHSHHRRADAPDWLPDADPELTYHRRATDPPPGALQEASPETVRSLILLADLARAALGIGSDPEPDPDAPRHRRRRPPPDEDDIRESQREI
jgi:hypothetical protein